MKLEDRYNLLRRAEGNPQLQEACLETSRQDPIFWFETFCWTYDPRKAPHSDIPFELYPFQKKFILELVKCIKTGESLLIEKSRDMGLSWLVMLTFQWFWIFEEGASFHVGGKVESDIDNKGNRSTLFGKIRYNIDFLPLWMLEKLKKTEDCHMKLVCPHNGNTITGGAATPNFGRGGRYKAILFDEFAFHPYGDYAFASASQASNSIICVSTPYGKANKFAKLRHDPKMEWIDLK